jgi:uncharacterized secreted protein with C-terminal beta-propeller domain
MQDPAVAQGVGQNPMGQQLMSALQAHIAEHLAFAYRKNIETQLGAPLPTPDEDLPEDIEVQLSRLVADAGRQLTQLNQQQAAQQQAQQQAQDPVIQMQQAEVQIKGQEVQRKAKKDAADTQIATAKLQLEREKLALEARDKQRQAVISALKPNAPAGPKK